MNQGLKLYRLLNILSVDVALGAVCCAAFFAKVFTVQLRPYALLALGITVWIIYTADHLMDAVRIKGEASTKRHRFHQKHFKALLLCLVLAVIVDVSLLFFIRTKILYAGLILSAIVGLYLLVNRWLSFVKEFVIAFVYCMGVLLPSVSLRSNSISLVEILLVTSFLLTALINLILFSMYDTQSDTLDGYNSFVIRFGAGVTRNILIVLFLMQAMVLATLFLKNDESYSWLFLAMNALLFLLFIKPSYFRQHDAHRLCGDAVFLFPVVFLAIG